MGFYKIIFDGFFYIEGAKQLILNISTEINFGLQVLGSSFQILVLLISTFLLVNKVGTRIMRVQSQVKIMKLLQKLVIMWTVLLTSLIH